MITKLRVKGFKTLRQVDVPLGRVTVLVGPNNSGKSNIIQALGLLGAGVRLSLQEALYERGGAKVLSTRGADGVIELGVEATIEETRFSYTIGTRSKENPHGVEFFRSDGEVSEVTFIQKGEFVTVPRKVQTAANPGAGLRYIGEDVGAPDVVTV